MLVIVGVEPGNSSEISILPRRFKEQRVLLRFPEGTKQISNSTLVRTIETINAEIHPASGPNSVCESRHRY